MSSKVRDYEKLAGDIIAAAGGKDNIAEVAHCATRLRLVLKEKPAGAKEKVSAMAGVITVVESGGQFQVVIGTHVTDVYNVAAEMLHLENSEGGSKATKGIAAAVIGAISGCVSPIVYVLAACGLLQGALIIATALYPAVEANTTFQVLTYMSWTPFTYLPVLIALAGSKYFKVDTLLAVLCCCALVNPSWGEIAGRIAAGEPL
ncbi:MAG: PTS transporter subunit EIIB, partial [Selenomonas sp.]|nr:PTS transporter subunit EIIB [Selenomonas sp.]